MIKTSDFGNPGCPGHLIKSNPNNTKGMIWFMPVMAFKGETITELSDKYKKLINKHNFDFISGVIMLNPRSLGLLIKISYDKSNEEHLKNVITLMAELKKTTNELGLLTYKNNTMMMNGLLDEQPALKNVNKLIKKALDPNSLLSPSKNDI